MSAASRIGRLLHHHPFTYRLALETYRRIRQTIWRDQGPVLQELPAHGPTSVSVEITQRCNLNCPICYRHVTEICDLEMSLDAYRAILDQFPALESADLVGKGETLMHRDIKGILALHRERGIKTNIVTNGHLLTPEISAMLLPGSMIQVSIDSPNPERYRGFRGAELTHVLKRMREAIAATSDDVMWATNTILVADNLQDMPATVELAADLRCKAVHFFMPMLFSSDSEAMHPHQHRALLNRMLRQARSLATKHRISLTRESRIRPRSCFAPWNTPRISVTGDVYPCTYVYVTNEAMHSFRWAGRDIPVPQGNFVMGNVLHGDDIAALWTGERFRGVRRQLLNCEKTKKHGNYDQCLQNYLSDTGGFNFCDICMHRHGIHC